MESQLYVKRNLNRLKFKYEKTFTMRIECGFSHLGCKNHINRPSRYCFIHTCTVESCTDHIQLGSNLCFNHKCHRKYCNARGIKRTSGYFTCEHCRYRCYNMDCSSMEFGDKFPFYCSTHGCIECHQEPKYKKLIKSEFCEDHCMCSVPGCVNLRVGRNRICLKPNRGHHLFAHEFPPVEQCTQYRPDVVLYYWHYVRRNLQVANRDDMFGEIYRMKDDTFRELITMICPLEFVTIKNVFSCFV